MPVQHDTFWKQRCDMESRGNDFTFFWASKSPQLFAKSSLNYLQNQWDKSRTPARKERDLCHFSTLHAPVKYMRLNTANNDAEPTKPQQPHAHSTNGQLFQQHAAHPPPHMAQAFRSSAPASSKVTRTAWEGGRKSSSSQGDHHPPRSAVPPASRTMPQAIVRHSRGTASGNDYHNHFPDQNQHQHQQRGQTRQQPRVQQAQGPPTGRNNRKIQPLSTAQVSSAMYGNAQKSSSKAKGLPAPRYSW